MNVYHGSQHIVKEPVFNGSKRSNDYGYGFYTTENRDLAREWTGSDNRDGYVNSYETDLEGLSVLRLNSPEYSVLNWLAILAKYRTFWQNGSVAAEAKEYLMRNSLLIRRAMMSLSDTALMIHTLPLHRTLFPELFRWQSFLKPCALANLGNRSCLKAKRHSRDFASPVRNR